MTAARSDLEAEVTAAVEAALALECTIVRGSVAAVAQWTRTSYVTTVHGACRLFSGRCGASAACRAGATSF